MISKPAVEAYGLRKAHSLRKAFGEVPALDGLSWRRPPDRCSGRSGRTGPGKTTTVSILATSLLPDACRATVGGLVVFALLAARTYARMGRYFINR